MTGFSDLRHNHDFTVLWLGQTASEVGTRVSLFVVPLITYALTGSTLMAGFAGGADLLGTALGLLPGGVLADRVDRRRLLRGAAGAGALLYASLVVAAALGALTLPHLVAAAFLTGVASGVFTPAETAAVRAVVPTEQLPTALSQMQARQHVASLVGGPLGGALYAVSRWAPFLFDAVSYAVAWLLLGRLRADLAPGPRGSGPRRSAGREIAEGLTFSWQRPLFRTLLLWSAAANLVINALFVVATLRLVQAGFAPWSIGLVSTAAGVAGVLGSMTAPWIIQRFATGPLTVVVGWSFVPLLLPLLLWNQPLVVAAALTTGVFMNPTGNAGISAYKTTVTPPELLGRVSATGQLVSWSTMPLAPVLGGGLLTALGGPAAMATLSVLCAAVAMIPTLSRSVRSVPRPSEWRVDWAGAGGGQRLGAGPAPGPQPEGPADPAIRPAGSTAGHA